MTKILRVLLVLCSLTTSAHFLRTGSIWDAIPFLAPMAVLFFPGMLPRPLLAVAALGGVWLWTTEAVELAQWRMNFDMPWIRMAIILGSVSVAHLGLFSLLLGRAGTIVGKMDKTSWMRTAIFMLVVIILASARAKMRFPILLGERFFPLSGQFWIFCFAQYGSVIGGWLATDLNARIRSQIWAGFSFVFFSQLALGLSGWSVFLMTGALHLPVPALILAGPLYRGEGYFMPALLGMSLLLVGPAWCSYLCYIGAWDDRLARWSPGRPQILPGWTRQLRVALLVATVAIPLALRFFQISWTWSLSIAALFGLIGLGIMGWWSRQTRTMAHCTVWCPIGLLNNLLGRILPWRIDIDNGCTGCGVCAKACRYNALTRMDLENKRPGLTCALCGDCLPRCPHGHIGYRFPGLNRENAHLAFLTLVTALHSVFLAVARI